MSAFICTPKHINTIVSYAAHKQVALYLTNESGQRYRVRAERDPELIAECLTKANYDSVNFRYSENTEIPQGEYFPVATAFISPVAIIKLIDCLDYQSCEVSNWEDTDAAKILRTIKGTAIDNLPGYSDAAWSI